MAKMNGHFYLTMKQVKMLSKGKDVKILREKRTIVLGLKKKADAIVRLKNVIAKANAKIKELEKGANNGTENH